MSGFLDTRVFEYFNCIHLSPSQPSDDVCGGSEDAETLDSFDTSEKKVGW